MENQLQLKDNVTLYITIGGLGIQGSLEQVQVSNFKLIAYCRVGLEDSAKQIQFTLKIISEMQSLGDGKFL